MQRPIAHILYLAIMPALFFLIALTPVEVLGCRNRGLLALLIALSSGIAALACVSLPPSRADCAAPPTASGGLSAP